jgi:hypothetical protein
VDRATAQLASHGTSHWQKLDSLIMQKVPRKFILAFVVFVVLYLIYQRLRIVIFIPLSPVGAFIALVVIVGVLYVVLDHLFNRE